MKSWNKVLNTDAAKLGVKELIYKVFIPAVFIVMQVRK